MAEPRTHPAPPGPRGRASVYSRLGVVRADLLDVDMGAADGVLHLLLVLAGLLGQRHLADDAGFLGDRDLFGGADHLQRLVLERGVSFLGAELAVDGLVIDADGLGPQRDGLLDRLLADAAAHAHAALSNLALGDGQLLLDLEDRLIGRARSLARLIAGDLVALHDRQEAFDLVIGGTRRDQRLAAFDRLEVAARVTLVEATTDDLGHDRLMVAVKNLGIRALEARLDELGDERRAGLRVVDRADDGGGHELKLHACW